MTDKSVVVAGVIYPGVEPYIKQYLGSLEAQTFNQFDLVFLVDRDVEVNDLKKYYSKKIIFHYSVDNSPAQNRSDLIKIILSLGYEFIIFTDTDDFFSHNRIETCVNKMQHNDIVVNDLDIVCEKGMNKENQYLSNRFTNNYKIKNQDILSCNVMGMSNTAARRYVLEKCLPIITSNVIAFDWLLWSYALLQGMKAEYTSETTTKYRIYSDNIGGLFREINESEVLKGISVKAEHYRQLSTLGLQQQKLYNSFSRAKNNSYNPDWLKDYVLALKKHQIDKPMWWENIRNPYEVGIL